MKVLITGGAGFVGSEIVNQLYSREGYEVTVLDSMNPQIHSEDWENSYLYKSIHGKCTFIKGDVRDFDLVKELIMDNNVIIHLASETGTGQSMYQVNHYNAVNIMGTSNLVQAILSTRNTNKVRKIILSSSRSVYGEGKYVCPACGVVYPNNREKTRMMNGDFNYCPKCNEQVKLISTTEDSEIHPSSLYAYTKYAQELMLKTMCPSINLDYTIFRFQNVYGVGQSLNNPYTGILSIFSTLMLENKPVNIFEDGLESRDFINVKDVAEGVIASISNTDSNGEIMNLGSGINTSVIDIAESLKRFYDSKSEISITGDFRMGDIAHNKADISKANRILGFSPKITLEEGLEAFCTWVAAQGGKNIGYEKSLSEMEESGLFVRNTKEQ